MTWASALNVASAAPPPLLPIQGYLTDASSIPLDGTHQIRFRLYDADTAGTSLFEETLDVNVADGFFTIYLGDTVPLDLAIFRDHADVYLGIKVGTDAEASPRLQLASTGFASLAAYCGDAETIGGLEPTDFQARVAGTCSSGQFMQSIDANGSVACVAPTESDPKVGSLSNGRWCTSDGSTVSCTANPPVLSEADPQVGGLTNGRWCTTDGSTVNCTTNPPILSEADPQVGTMAAGAWCTSDGSAVNCGQAAPVLSETDPQVGSNTANMVPRWDGAALVSGRITDNGTLVGVNNNSPNEELDVGGDVEVTGTFRYATPRTYYTFIGPMGFDSTSGAADAWQKSGAGYAYLSDSDVSNGSHSMATDLAIPDGATLTGAACYYYDNSTSDGLGYIVTLPSFGALQFYPNFVIYRRAFTSTSNEVVLQDDVTTTAAGTATTPTASGWSDNTATVGTDVVDNSAYDYYMVVGWYVTNDTLSTLRFYGCRISYTMSVITGP